MGEGILVFGGISVAWSLMAHLLLRRHLLAVAVAAFGAAFTFQVAVFFQLGYLDPFALVAFYTTAALGGVVAAILGAPFALVRGRGRELLRHLATAADSEAAQQEHGPDEARKEDGQ